MKIMKKLMALALASALNFFMIFISFPPQILRICRRAFLLFPILPPPCIHLSSCSALKSHISSCFTKADSVFYHNIQKTRQMHIKMHLPCSALSNSLFLCPFAREELLRELCHRAGEQKQGDEVRDCLLYTSDLHRDVVGSLHQRVAHLIILTHLIKFDKSAHGPPPYQILSLSL